MIDHAELAETRQQPDVLAQRDRPLLLDGAGEHAILATVDRPDQLAPHPPSRSGDGDLHLVHGVNPRAPWRRV